ncbi:cardiolipin synthase [Anaerolineales bacterium HSG6]|nr:cardiolipin synthase [Anaerolineales bacterium HSG6]MDM8532817.1 cardiolipin synthase [Anaerolineales bacterium HSG25]
MKFPILGVIVATIYEIGRWVIRLTMLVIVPRRQQPSVATAWLLLVLFFPWLGGLLYFMVGENRLPHRRLKKHARILKGLETVNEGLKYRGQIHPDVAPAMEPVIKLAEKLGQFSIVGHNGVDVISGYENIIDRIIEDIDTAEEFVHLEFYIYANDEQGKRLSEALARATERGAKCRVLVDAVGVRSFLGSLWGWMEERGIEIHEMLPASPFRMHVQRVDLRNHRKIVVIDGQIAYTGSQNIINSDYGYNVAGLVYEELMVRLTGPVVHQLQAVFASDWYFETDELLGAKYFPESTKTGTIPAQTLPSGPTYDMENFQRLVINMLYAAKERVVITTPYFLPDQQFMHAVETARLRGVEIEVIVSQRDQLLVGLGQSAFYQDMLDAGVKIHKYMVALLHAKHMTIDDQIALIGSSNIDVRSMALNFEVNVLFYGPKVVEMLQVEHKRYIENSELITLEEWNNRPFVERVIQDFAKLFSPLM